MLKKLKTEFPVAPRYFLTFLLIFSWIKAQPLFIIEELIEFPGLFIAQNFFPDKIATGIKNRIYLLDRDSRQIALLTSHGTVRFAGGFGREQDAFFDPVDITVEQLNVWISDRVENRLIGYDYQLNFIHSAVHNPIYPELISADSWGNIYLYSEQDQAVYRRSVTGWESSPFIDLTANIANSNCVSDMQIAKKGSLAFLYSCDNQVVIYNRLGRLLRRYPVLITAPSTLISMSDKWLITDATGKVQLLNDDKLYNFPLEENILDVAVIDNLCYILTSHNIVVLRVQFQ